jgi:branched-chain amino acid aminotransferase
MILARIRSIASKVPNTYLNLKSLMNFSIAVNQERFHTGNSSSPGQLFDLQQLDINLTSEPRQPRFEPADLVFGATHTDHMLRILYQNEKWGKPEIIPFQPIDMHPFNTTFQAAVTCYEGLKAYKGADKVNFFLESTTLDGQTIPSRVKHGAFSRLNG